MTSATPKREGAPSNRPRVRGLRRRITASHTVVLPDGSTFTATVSGKPIPGVEHDEQIDALTRYCRDFATAWVNRFQLNRKTETPYVPH